MSAPQFAWVPERSRPLVGAGAPLRATPSNLAIRGSILHFLDDPVKGGDHAYQYFDDGILHVVDGIIRNVGPASELLPMLSDKTTVKRFPHKLITPGFIDCHIHYEQSSIIASYGEQLWDWIEDYVFPITERFSDVNFAREQAHLFLDLMLCHGTTSAMVFASSYREANDAFFEAVRDRNLRLIAGEVNIGRNAPEVLIKSPEQSEEDALALIDKWHGKGRLHYAVELGMAPTSTEALMKVSGKILADHPSVYFHAHLAENQHVVEWTKKLYPWSKDYVDVYASFGLVGKRSVFAHGVWLDESEFERLSAVKSTIAFCPTSNLFLGSGLFKLAEARTAGVTVGIGTDIGAGTSFSLLRTLLGGYKVQQLRHYSLSSFDGLYMATLGGARALSIEDKVGNFEVGKEADFVILDATAMPIQKERMASVKDLGEALFVLTMLGDERNVLATYLMGQRVYARDS